MTSKSTPYFCPACTRSGACGYNGILVFEGDDTPSCRHNEPNRPPGPPGRPCHDQAIQMVPVHG
jgi:hypothetical protein